MDVSQAVEALCRGEVIALPTDTVYGLAALFDHAGAIERIYQIKGRPTAKAIPVLLDDVADLQLIAPDLPLAGQALARAFWPGAITMVVRAREGLLPGVTSESRDGARTIAVRVPNHGLARHIIRAAGGALAVTSANRSGEAPALDAAELRGLRLGALAYIVDGGRVPGGVPSTVIDLTGAGVTILREGAISKEMLESALVGISAAAVSNPVSAV